MNRIGNAIGLVLIMLLGCEFAQAGSATLSIGTLGDEPAKLIRTYQPVAKYLATHLSRFGITEGRVVITKSANEMGEMMRQGKVDVFIDSPMPTIGVNHIGGGKMILRRWKGGVGEYRSVIFTLRDNSIKSIADLRGKNLAFEQPFSSTGYILPRIIFERDGESLNLIDTSKVNSHSGKIGYSFSGDDENTMEWVLRGRVDAGAMSHNNVEKYAKTSLSKLNVIWESPPIPRHIVSVRNDLAAEMVANITSTLTEMDKTPEGQDILANFEKTAKFDSVPSQTIDLFERYRTAVVELLKM